MLRNDSSWFFFFDFVESVHRGNDAFVNRAFHRLRCSLDGRSYERLFLLEKIGQDIIARSLARRRTNPNSQSRNIIGRTLKNDRFQSVVTAGSAALPDS